MAGLCWEDDCGYREGIYSVQREGSVVVFFFFRFFFRLIVRSVSGWKARDKSCGAKVE